MSPIPNKHEELLEEEIESLHSGEETSILKRYDAIRPNLRPVGKKLIDDMLLDLDRFVELIEKRRSDMSERQFLVAIAAIKYFVRDADHIDEDLLGLTGLVDDAIVVKAARRELQDLL